MKRITALFLTVVMLLSAAAALADGPADPTLLDRSDMLGYPTHYLLYDRDYYEAECDQPGTVVQMKYTSSVYGEKTYKRTINVYLPYGYDENGTERYPVIYFFHGRGCNQDTLLMNPQTKNAFDNMIKDGIIRPFIMVTPTYYYDVRKLLMDLDLFAVEMRTEMMPLVEGTYRTYAETPDEAGFIASRNMRAISGYSLGSMNTWYLIDLMADVSSTFLPFAAPAMELKKLEAFLDSDSPYAHDLFIYYCMGGEEDTATGEMCMDMARKLPEDDHFSIGLDRQTNNIFVCLSDNIHQDLTSRYYYYNAFADGILFR